jgi:hypothetical protein
MNFEGLANELLLDLFELLNNVHLLHAFYGLNSRINTLLVAHCRTCHLDFRSISKQNFNMICQQYLPTIIDRVVSLHLSNGDETPNLLQLFHFDHFIITQFNHLQKLSLYHMRSADTLNQILTQCRQLTHLSLVKCKFDSNVTDVPSLINNIWSLSKLTHCNLDHIFLNEILFLDMPIISQSIEHLIVGTIHCPLNNLFYLLKCTPQPTTTVCIWYHRP